MHDVTSIGSTKLPPSQWDDAALRSLLIDQLATMLKVDPSTLDPTKSFDAYGLDSIDAVIATGWLSDQLGVDLPPEFLFRHTSVDRVVRALRSREYEDTPAPAKRGNRPRIFFFPGAGGRDEQALVRFREHPTQRLGFEVMRIGGWREWIAQDLDFDGIVRCSCRHIEQVVPDGPLLFAGYSQGGQIAYATARALERSGRTVKFIGLLDCDTWWPALEPSPSPGIAERAASSLRLTKSLAARLMTKSPSGEKRIRLIARLWPTRRDPSEQKKLRKRIAWLSQVLCYGAGGVRLDVFVQMRIFRDLSDAWRAQTDMSKRLDAPTILFRSEDAVSDDRGWREYCTDLTLVPVAGDHHTMFEGAQLEELIQRFIAAVE